MTEAPPCACHEPEEWRPCPPNPRYLVSSHGRVRRAGKPRPLKLQPHTRGYLIIDLGKKCRARYVHALVAEAWHDQRPAGHDVDHLDHDKHHNCTSNLRWLRSVENAVRWAGHRDDGSIVWAHRDEPLPHEDPDLHPALLEAELAQLTRELAAAGWAT
jgi:hypothetical protein